MRFSIIKFFHRKPVRNADPENKLPGTIKSLEIALVVFIICYQVGAGEKH